MINVAGCVCENKVVDVGVRKGRILILEKAIERENNAKDDCGKEYI